MKAFTLCLLSFLLLAGASLAAEPRTVDLRQAERLALERNLELRAQTLDTRATEAAVRREYGLYDPRLQAEYAEGVGRERISFVFFGQAVTKSVVDSRTFNLSLNQTLPTGAELALGFDNLREDSSLPTRTFNPSYTGELKLSLAQPLLRDFGRTVTEQEILFAVKDREISVNDLRERAFDVLTRVRNAYFDVLRFRENLAYRETSVELARRILEENRARVEAGVLPPVEILEAEVGLKLRERELLDARRAYRDALDNLALLLNLEAPVEAAEETLGQPELETAEEEGFRAALEKRPDLQRRRRQIERLRIERQVDSNRTLPSLDLKASYSQKGLGEDYDDNLDDIASEEFTNWEVGLELSYPLGNREARNELRRTDLQLKRSHALLAQLRDEARNEIRAAIRLLEVNREKIEVTRRGRDLAEEKLRILLKRKEVGLATTRDVLEGEEDLAQARTDQIAALADYNQAVTEYLRVTGRLLEEEGIAIVALPDPQSEEPLLKMTNPWD